MYLGHRPVDRPFGDAGPSGAPVDVDVLVVGAGPSGLTAASEAIRHGLSVRIIDRKPRRSGFSKALVAHARTLEVFQTMGVADAVLAEGVRFAALNVNAGPRRRATRIDLLGLPWGDTAFPFWLSIPQYSTERILETHLNELGAGVEWQASLDEIQDRGAYVEARVLTGDGEAETIRSRWLIGCDGGRSRVREQVGLHLSRVATGVTFILADVKTAVPLVEDEGHVFVGAEALLLIVPMPEPGRWRIIAHEPDVSSEVPPSIDADYLNELILRRTGLDFGSRDIAWQSRFELSHGLVDRYRRGRVFLAGDAAHVHSPVGGQGLNTGIQDAHNLMWKLALSRHMPADQAAELLDSYEAERRAVARAMVEGVARVTGVITNRHRALRRVVGVLAPRALRRPAVQAKLGRRVGMLDVSYRHGPHVFGRSRNAGRRMPNPELRSGGRLYERLDPERHTWVIRAGQDSVLPPDVPEWRELRVVYVPDEEFLTTADRDGMPRVALVRPDRYVAAAGESETSVWSDLVPMTRSMPHATSSGNGPAVSLRQDQHTRGRR